MPVLAHIEVTPRIETGLFGILAVGDIDTCLGKEQLTLSGFDETGCAAFGAAQYALPDKKIHLRYTNTSPRLHKVPGVASPVFERKMQRATRRRTCGDGEGSDR